MGSFIVESSIKLMFSTLNNIMLKGYVVIQGWTAVCVQPNSPFCVINRAWLICLCGKKMADAFRLKYRTRGLYYICFYRPLYQPHAAREGQYNVKVFSTSGWFRCPYYPDYKPHRDTKPHTAVTKSFSVGLRPSAALGNRGERPDKRGTDSEASSADVPISASPGDSTRRWYLPPEAL